MKALFLAGLIAGQCFAASPFPWWFHTRPKPVFVDQQQSGKTPTARAVAVSHPVQRPKSQPQPQAPKSTMAQFIARHTK